MSYIVGCYSQIPHGSPKKVYERALEDSLKPFLTEVYNRDKAYLQLYMTGSMIEWLDNNHKEVDMLIKDLVKCDKLELLTGSYYQAILPLVPQSDRVAQIEKATTTISRKYKMLAKTFWCYGEIWDPSLISSLKLSKIENVIVSSESLNIKTGFDKPFRMMEMGKTIGIIPPDSTISKAIMNYSQSNIDFDELYSIIEKTNTDGKNHLAMINLNQLLQGGITQLEIKKLIDLLFDDNLANLECLWDQSKPLPVHYLDKGWYGFDSLLNSDESIQEVLSKDYGLSYLYNRLLGLNEVARHYKKDRDVKKRISKLIPKIHCGAPYLCDSNASLIRGEIRANLWTYLIKIEKILNSLDSFSYPYVSDFDNDGLEEVMSRGKTINAVIDSKGGSFLELKYYPAECNFADAIVPKGPFFKKEKLVIPGKKLKVLNDILLDCDYNMSEYRMIDNKISENTYTLEPLDKKYTEFGLVSSDIFDQSIKYTKHYKFYSNEIELETTIENVTELSKCYKVGFEIPLTFFPYNNSLDFIVNEDVKELNSDINIYDSVGLFKISDKVNKARITVSSPTEFSLLAKNVMLEKSTTLGIENLYQFSFLATTWDIKLEPYEIKSIVLKIRIERR